VILLQSYKPYTELKQWAREQGVLTREDIGRVARSKKIKDSEEPAVSEEIFPGTRWFAASLQYADGHARGGGLLDPSYYSDTS